MKTLVAIGALGFMASGLFAQGLNPPSTQTKEDWEEINFEFNSSILSDGYPSLLRLADLLSQHRDYHVKVTGNTDSIGSARYNDKLGMARANTVKEFLVKYGVNPDQVTAAGNGLRDPEVNNRVKEGRFINRRVVLAVTDGQGRLVKEGGINDILRALQAALQDMAKKQQDCCDAILKRLDKLDDILAALKGLQGENDRLKGDEADLRNQLNALKDQISGMPKPLSEQATTDIAHKEAIGAVDEAQKRNKKYSTVGLSVGPNFGPNPTGPTGPSSINPGASTTGFNSGPGSGQDLRGNATVEANGRFFAPFGGDGTHAVQAQGEYMWNSQGQEGQFDVGLVNRWGNVQAGGFASFKYLNYRQYQQGGSLAEGAFLVDYLFKGGRVGVFGTQGFKNTAVLNMQELYPGVYNETYAHIINQYGFDAQVGVWGDAYLQGNIGVLHRYGPGEGSTPGGQLRLVQPIVPKLAFTAEYDYNASLVGTGSMLLFGLQVGNYIKPKEFADVKTPVPMDVPRIRYEFLTRRVGTAPPVADAGPPQIGVAAGIITLNGSGSHDPLGEPLTFSWKQIGGPSVSLSGANTATPTFMAAAGQSYVFQLTVTNTDGLSGSATTSVQTLSATALTISQFYANPATVNVGQSTTLIWVLQGATSASISPGIGAVNANSGSVAVSPAATTTYILTATGASGTVTQSVTVTVGAPGSPQIVRFAADPNTIPAGGSVTLSWSTNNASTVAITPNVGTVTANGSTTVSPAATTTYTLTATNSAGSVTATATVTVSGSSIPQIVTFVATPQNISPGQSTKLCWQVTGSTNISIAPGVGTNLNSNDCATVSPATTTTYTLTATNAAGQIQGNVTVNVGQVQILSFTATPPNSTYAGSPVVLAWTTANATSVVLIGGDLGPTTLQPNGSYTINPVSNQTYTLTAYGPGGQTVSVTISVFVR
jgi:hypothetical protein